VAWAFGWGVANQCNGPNLPRLDPAVARNDRPDALPRTGERHCWSAHQFIERISGHCRHTPTITTIFRVGEGHRQGNGAMPVVHEGLQRRRKPAAGGLEKSVATPRLRDRQAGDGAGSIGLHAINAARRFPRGPVTAHAHGQAASDRCRPSTGRGPMKAPPTPVPK